MMMNKALRLIRVFHDMNQTDAAKFVGLSKSYLSEMEKGHKRVSLDVMEKYSDAFDIPMSSLMLFAERADESDKVGGAREFVAGKTLKMLDWISTISKERVPEADA